MPANSPGRSGGGARTPGRAKLLAGYVKFLGYSTYIQRNDRTGHYRSTPNVFSRRHFQERGIFRDIGELILSNVRQPKWTFCTLERADLGV